MIFKEDIQLIEGDCLSELDFLEDNSIDLVVCDLPYGVTRAKHDLIIPMEDFIEYEIRNKIKKDSFRRIFVA